MSPQKKIFRVGDKIDCVITEIDKDKRRIAISYRLTKENPFDLIEKNNPVGTEVSGSISSYVANLLCELANHRQVFCVTHQPLIAAFADNHFALKKSVIDGHTKSVVIDLKQISDRQRELALLAGGEIVEANDYAASLLEHNAA